MDESMEKLQSEQAEAAGAEKTAGTAGGGEQEPEKKYTDADVDRIVAKKIAAERKRMSRVFTEEQQISEIEQRERNVLLRELKADAKDALIGQGLPASLSGLLNYSSRDELEQSMAEVSRIFNEAVQQGVKERLRGNTPVMGCGYGGKALDREKALRDAFAPGVR
jgi:hypothetical protein